MATFAAIATATASLVMMPATSTAMRFRRIHSTALPAAASLGSVVRSEPSWPVASLKDDMHLKRLLPGPGYRHV